MTRSPLRVYVAASLLTDDGVAALASVLAVGIQPTVVGAVIGPLPAGFQGVDDVPDDLAESWYLTDQPAAVGAARTRTILIGPTRPSGRRTEIGVRTARDLRTALIEIASEHLTD